MTNTGNQNTGNRNTGAQNTGNRNTGAQNTGNQNTGNQNTGYRNTGYRNTGDQNTGDKNTGDRNAGNRNTGDKNTGNRNTGNQNTGYLNTNDSTIRIFNKNTEFEFGDIVFPDYFCFDFTPTHLERVKEEYMTELEKGNNNTYKTIGGYLKTTENEKELKYYRKKSFDNAEIDDIKKTLELPNFDYDIFEEITSISKEDFDRILNNKVSFNGKEFVNKEELIEYIKNM